MKVLKDSGSYLERKAKSNRNTSISCIAVGLAGFLCAYLLATSLVVFPSFIVLVIGVSFLGNYSRYKSGIEGENTVVKFLSALDDNYYLINDVKLPESYGNIDHIVLGPNGIFVIETKNYRGQIRCNGDDWVRHYEGTDREYDLGSPSKQAKRNAIITKQSIESANTLKKFLSWVEGIVVFTNPEVGLKLSKTTVPVLRPENLCEYIKNKKSKIGFSTQELESIGKTILKQSI